MGLEFARAIVRQMVAHGLVSIASAGGIIG
jgi:hypothetical protein